MKRLFVCAVCKKGLTGGTPNLETHMIKSSLKAIGLMVIAVTVGLVAGSVSANASPLVAGNGDGGNTLAAHASGSSAGANVVLIRSRGQARRGHRSHRRSHRRGYRKGVRRGYHKGRYYGKRYRHRRYGYNHFYGGYWYPYAWWVGPAIGTTIVIQSRANSQSAHVNWCLDRYRSYNPNTDMFLAYSGRYKPCISPYSY